MTVIVAAKVGKRVVMAADRQVSLGGTQLETSEPKIWIEGKYVIGCAGSLRSAQILKYEASWPTWRPKEEPNWMRHVVTRVVPAIRKALAKYEVEDEDSVYAVIANRGRFATIYSDGAVIADHSPRAVIGSGMGEALGYLGDTGPWGAVDVVTAVRRAVITNTGCSGFVSVADTRLLEVVTEGDE